MGNTVAKCLSESILSEMDGKHCWRLWVSILSEMDGKHCWQMSVRIYCVRNGWETLLTNVCQNLLWQKLVGNTVDKCLSESILSEMDGKHCWRLWESILSEIDGKHCWQMSVRICFVRNWWETQLTNVCQYLLCQKLMGNTVDKCLSESIVSEIGGKHCCQMSVRIYFVRNWWETLLTNIYQNLLCQKWMGNTVDKCLSESIVSEIGGKHCWQMSVRIFCVRNWWETLLPNVCQNLFCQKWMGNTVVVCENLFCQKLMGNTVVVCENLFCQKWMGNTVDVCENLFCQKLMGNTVAKCPSESVLSEIDGKYSWQMSVSICCVRNWWETLLTNVCQNLLCQKLMGNTVAKCVSESILSEMDGKHCWRLWESILSEIDGKHCWQMSVRICCVRNWWETLLTNVCQNLFCHKLMGNIADKCLSESIVSEIDGKHCWQCLSEPIVSEIDGKHCWQMSVRIYCVRNWWEKLLTNVCQNLLCQKLIRNTWQMSVRIYCVRYWWETLDKCLSETVVSEIGGKHCWQMSVRICCVRNWWETLDKCLSETVVSEIGGKHCWQMSVRIYCVRNGWETLLTNVCQNLLCQKWMGNTWQMSVRIYCVRIGGKHCCQMSVRIYFVRNWWETLLPNVCQNLFCQKLMGNTVAKCLWESIVSEMDGKHCCQMSVRIYCVRNGWETLLSNVYQNLLCHKLMGNIADKCLSESILSEIGGKQCCQMSVRIYFVRSWWETVLPNVCQNLFCQKLMGNTVDKYLSESIVSEMDGKHCWQMSVRIYCVRNGWETLLTNVCQNLLCQKLMGNTVAKCLSESILSEMDGKHCWRLWESILSEIDGKHCWQISIKIYFVRNWWETLLTNVCQNLFCQKLMGNTVDVCENLFCQKWMGNTVDVCENLFCQKLMGNIVDKCLSESILSEIDGKHCCQMSVRIYFVRNGWETLLTSVRIYFVRNWWETLLPNVRQNLFCQKLMGNTVDKCLSVSVVSEIDGKHCWQMSVRIYCVRNWWETLLPNVYQNLFCQKWMGNTVDVCENLFCQKLMGNIVDKCLSESILSEIDGKHCCQMSVRILFVRNGWETLLTSVRIYFVRNWWETLLPNVRQNLFCQKLMGNTVYKCLSVSVVSEIDGKHCWQMSFRIYCVRNWWETLLPNVYQNLFCQKWMGNTVDVCENLFCQKLMGNIVDKCLSESILSEIDGKHCCQMSVRIYFVRNGWETLLTSVRIYFVRNWWEKLLTSVRIYFVRNGWETLLTSVRIYCVRNWWETLLTNVCQNLLCQKLMGNTVDKCLSESIVSEIDGKHCCQMSIRIYFVRNGWETLLTSVSIYFVRNGWETLLTNVCQNLLCQKWMGNTVDKCLSESIVAEIGGKHCWQMSIRIYFVRNGWETLLTSVRIYFVRNWWETLLTNVCQNMFCQKLMGNTVDKCLSVSVVSEIDGKHCWQMSFRIYCVRNWWETLLPNVCQNLFCQKLMGNTVDKYLSESIVSEMDGKHCWQMSVRIYCVRNWWETLLTNVCQNLLCQKLMGNTVAKCLSESILSEIGGKHCCRLWESILSEIDGKHCCRLWESILSEMDGKHCWRLWESILSEIDGKHCCQMSVRICFVRNWWEIQLTNVCQYLLCQKLMGNTVDKCLSESIVSEIDGKHCCQMCIRIYFVRNGWETLLTSVRIYFVRNWWETLLTNVCQNLFCQKLMGNTVAKCLSESFLSEMDGKHCWRLWESILSEIDGKHCCQMSVRICFVRNWWEIQFTNVCQYLLCQKLMGNTVDKCLSESIVSEIDGKHCCQMSIRIFFVRNGWETLLTSVRIYFVRNWWETLLTNVCQNLFCQKLMGNTVAKCLSESILSEMDGKHCWRLWESILSEIDGKNCWRLWESILSEMDGKHCWRLWESIVSEIDGKHCCQMSVRICFVRNWWEIQFTNVCQYLLCQKLMGNTVDKCLSESIVSEIDGKHCCQMSIRIYFVRNGWETLLTSVRIYFVRNWWETLLTNVCQNLFCQKLMGNTVAKCLSESILSEMDGKHCWRLWESILSEIDGKNCWRLWESILSEMDGKHCWRLWESIVSEIDGKHCWQMSVRICCVRN